MKYLRKSSRIFISLNKVIVLKLYLYDNTSTLITRISKLILMRARELQKNDGTLHLFKLKRVCYEKLLKK